MKKILKILYFTPAIVLFVLTIASFVTDTVRFANYIPVLVSFAVMVCVGLLMGKGKMWGSVIGFAFFAGWALMDYVSYVETNPDMINYRVTAVSILWPVIAFYAVCIVGSVVAELISKNKQ